MYKKTIEYEDYNGVLRTEDHYFHLNEAEITNWLTTDGDYTLDKKIEMLANENNGKKIMEIFEDLIHRSYGRKSLDGRRFDKTEEIWEDFRNTEAYSKLFMELVTDATAAANFVNGIIPTKLAAEIQKTMADNPEGIPANIRDYIPAAKNNNNPTAIDGSTSAT